MKNKLKTRLAALFCAAALLITSCPAVYAAEETATPAVTVSSVSVNPGSTCTVTVKSSNFSAVTALELLLAYDSNALEVTNTSTSSMTYASVNTKTPGFIQYAGVSEAGVSGDKTLLSITFKASAEAEARVYSVSAFVTEATALVDDVDTNIAVSAVPGSVTVNKKTTTTPTAYFYGKLSNTSIEVGEEVSLTVYSSTLNGLSSGQFSFSYDSDLFEFVSLEPLAAMTKNTYVHSVNSANAGIAVMAFASDVAVSTGDLMKLTLKAKETAVTSTKITFEPNSLVNAEAQPLGFSNSASKDVTITAKEAEIVLPKLWVEVPSTVRLEESFIAELWVEGSAGLAAGDFSLSYDATRLECISVTSGQDPGEATDASSYVVINDDYQNGAINFSALYGNGISEDTQLLSAEFRVKKNEDADFALTPAVVSTPVDKNVKAISLECLSAESTIIAKVPETVAITALPSKLTYLEGKDSLDVTGGKIAVTYDYGADDLLDLTADMVSGFDNTIVGKQTLTVTYGSLTDTFEVEVIAKSVSTIEFAAPNKVSYLEAKDALDVAGGKITIYYNNDTNDVVDLTADMVSGFDNTIVGKQTLTVTYGDFTDTFEIEVVAKSIASIGIATLPINLEYFEGDVLDVTDGKITIYYNNDTSEVIALTADMVSGFDSTIVGKQTLTITYEGKMTSFNVNVEKQYFAGGRGTESDPFLIANATQLNYVRNNLSIHYKMVADIEFADADFAEGGAFYNGGAGWTPIGNYSKKFTGNFDGNGHTITGLMQNISASGTVYGGLFGYVSGATIKNLGMEDSEICVVSTSSDAYAGGIAGYVDSGTISNCYNTGAVMVESSYHVYAGGIVGQLHSGSTISECYNAGAVSALISNTSTASYPEAYAGGIVGRLYSGSTISECYNTGAVTATGLSSSLSASSKAHAGGIAGYTSGDINECYNTGAVTAKAEARYSWYSPYAGGIAGYVSSDSTISNCYSTGAVTAESSSADAYAGGIASCVSSSGTISKCYNTGAVIATASAASESSYVYAYAGGIVSYVSGSDISGCYNTSAVTAEAYFAYAGGIAGDVDNSTISACYNTGAVNASSSSYVYAGGIASDASGSSTINECYNTGAVNAHALASSSSNYIYMYVAGIVGLGTDVAISNCYNTGTVTTTASSSDVKVSTSVGAIGGFVYGNSSFSECYYLDNCARGLGLGSYTTVKCTSNQMLDKSTFVGFDFADTWTMSGSANYLYPKLQGVPMTFEEELSGIEVTTLPNKTTYVEGDVFDSTGLVVTAYYTGGRTAAVTPDSVSGYTATVGTDTITVTYGDYTATFEIEIVAKSISSIAVSTLPTKLSYLEETENLDVAGGKITVYYNNGTSTFIDLAADMVNGFDNTIVGKQTLTVTYGSLTDTFEIEIIAKSVSSIEVVAPSKLSYLEGESLDVTGGKLTVYYNNDTSEEISLTIGMISGFNNAVIGKQVLTVSYEGFTATFEVEVAAKPISISISSVSATVATLAIANNEAGTCYVAIYDTYGKMLSCGLTSVSADAGEVTVSITPFTTTSQYTVKAFLVDSQGIPVCECAES